MKFSNDEDEAISKIESLHAYLDNSTLVINHTIN